MSKRIDNGYEVKTEKMDGRIQIFGPFSDRKDAEGCVRDLITNYSPFGSGILKALIYEREPKVEGDHEEWESEELVRDMARIKLHHNGGNVTICQVSIDARRMREESDLRDEDCWDFVFALRELLPPGWKLVKVIE